MGTNTNKNVELPNIVRKDIYTAEEKKIIIDRLDEERRIHQNAEADLNIKTKDYDEDDKQKLLQQLNEKRLTTQKREKMEKARIENKKVYKFGSKEFYKFKQMEREYYIQIADIKQISSRAAIIPLYYRTLDEFNKKEVLIKTEIYSEKIFISYNPIRVYFKGYALEDEYK